MQAEPKLVLYHSSPMKRSEIESEIEPLVRMIKTRVGSKSALEEILRWGTPQGIICSDLDRNELREIPALQGLPFAVFEEQDPRRKFKPALLMHILKQFMDQGLAIELPNLMHPRLFRFVILGLSTGGPQALEEILPKLKLTSNACLIILQHMPDGKTESLAAYLSTLTQYPVLEVASTQRLHPENVYIMRSGRQCFFGWSPEQEPYAVVTSTPIETLHKPSIDISFCSAGLAFTGQLWAGLLTGMGRDGAIGLKQIQKLGGMTAAESESSAVVYGMPRAAIELGAANKIIPLNQFSDTIYEWLLQRNLK